jgi:tetratricopeptide (TPR) repeat protein
MSLAIGAVLAGRYRVLARLGEGGMGSVYQAEDLRVPGRLWAVKELLGDAHTTPEEQAAAIQRFDAEVALMARFSNPRIPAVVDRFYEGGHHYFVMDFVPGASLETRLAQANGPLPERQVLEWCAQVCDVLAYLHAQQPSVILRDLKPGNIMVTPTGEVRVIDFGIARTYKLGQTSNTENLGTLIYASPEHLGQTGQTDARSDIYSLGATMYHLLTNHEPTPMDTPAPGTVRRLNPALSAAAEQVVIRAMQLDPNHRFQRATEMGAALRACLTAPAIGATSQATPAGSRLAGPAARIPTAPAIHSGRGGASAGAARSPFPSPDTSASVPRLARVQGGVVCPHCGYLNRTGARFCARDGVALPGVSSTPPAASASLRDQRSVGAGHASVGAPTRAAATASPSANAHATGASAAVRKRATIPVPAATDSADLSFQRGAEALAAGRNAQAARMLEVAIAQGRATYDTHLLLGKAYRQLSRPHDAAPHFVRAGRLRPTADAYLQAGLAEREAGQPAQAQVWLTKARQLSPEDPAIAYHLGQACLEQGLLAQAEGELQAGLTLQPDHPSILLALGRVRALRHEWEGAIEYFRRAIAADANNAGAYLDLGRALLAVQRLNEATRTLEQAVRLAPTSAESQAALGMCYHAQGKRRQARKALERAQELDPGDVEVQRLLKQV